MKPMSDLCWKCQVNSTVILRSRNSSEHEKSEALQNALEHLRIVTMERSFYRSVADECRRSIQSHFKRNGEFEPPQLSAHIPANSQNIKAHYSFDYAQMVSIAIVLDKKK